MSESLLAFERASNPSAATSCSENIRAASDRISFRHIAEFVWPNKTAFELAARTGASERMCRYWLAGNHAAPWSAVSVVLGEIIRRLD